MQIKSILATAAFAGCMLIAGTGMAAMSEEKASPMMEKDPEARSDGASMNSEPVTQSSKPEAPRTVRNTRPKIDRHKDARACLEAGKNEAIIKCANRYR